MSGDGAKRDSDGYIWITGRLDDMLNVSGKEDIRVKYYCRLNEKAITASYFSTIEISILTYMSSMSGMDVIPGRTWYPITPHTYHSKSGCDK